VVPGERVVIGVLRDRQRQALTVTIGEQPGDDTRVAAAPKAESFGLTVEPVGPESAERSGRAARAGVVVTAVAPGSAGAEAGIRPGDAVLEVDRRPVTDVESFRAAATAVRPGDLVPVYIRRGKGGNQYVVLRAPTAGR
jgi:serine protease Do